jgi:tRNA(Phe) wybutosine-synthesizing methylase Tyw3
MIRHSGGRTRVFEHGIAIERVGAIRVADVHHKGRNEEVKEKLERKIERVAFLGGIGSIVSNSDGNRREGGRA